MMPIRRLSSSQFIRSDSTQLRLDSRKSDLNLRSLPSERKQRIQKLMSFAGTDAPSEKEPVSFERIPTNLHGELHEMPDQEERELLFTSNYEDYLDQLLQKLDLLMSLNQPWDVLKDEENGMAEDAQLQIDRKQIIASLTRNSSVIIEEKGVVPESREDLILICVKKYLLMSTTVTCKHLTESLQRRSENAQNKRDIFEEASHFLSLLHSFPQASRLFLLGLIHEMTVFSTLCVGGYHDGKRRNEGSYGLDYLGNCEGASIQIMQSLLTTLTSFCESLKNRFQKCVETLQWRLGTTILWFLTTVISPKLPLFSYHLHLLPFLQESSLQLSKWYEMTNDYSKDILISPGPFWDSLSEKKITVNQSHFHRMLRDIQENWEYVNTQTATITGIFPESVMALANAMRLASTIILIQAFSDYLPRSRQSPAQNADTLYNWTLTDVSNLFVRLSAKYMAFTCSLFHCFMKDLSRQQRVLKERCDAWQPFAPISYHTNESAGNPYSCVKVVDEKNIMRGMIATDMLISAGEGLIASNLALTLFISHTRLSLILPWDQYGGMLWNMLYFSPRHQKLTIMLFQYIIPATDYIPPVFQELPDQFTQITPGTPDADSVLKNPLLKPPSFPSTPSPSLEQREAFIYFLLHLISHSDGCPGALIGERTSCALCCTFFPFIYNTLCRSSPSFSIPNKDAYMEEILITRQKVFVSSCKMCIRPDGHTAAFCSLVFAEEVVYLMRRMLETQPWASLTLSVFQDVLNVAAEQLQNEKLYPRQDGFHVVLRRRTPWFCMATAVLKVLGAITPRMYAGSRIRIHEFLMDGENDMSTLIHTAYQSHGTGTIIKYHRSMGEALVLMDKLDTPKLVNCYVFDVVDRIEPPQDRNGVYGQLLVAIEHMLKGLDLNEELFTLPAAEMPFFNTSDLCLNPSQLQNIILYLYCVRCINHLVISNDTLATQLQPEIVQLLWKMALRPLPCNVSFNTLIVRQYFNWFIEYLIDTYTGSARLLPMELQTEEDGEIVHGRDKVDPRFGFGKEEEEEVRFDEGEETDGPKVIRNEKRMKKAREIAVICNVDVMVAYAVLQVCISRER